MVSSRRMEHIQNTTTHQAILLDGQQALELCSAFFCSSISAISRGERWTVSWKEKNAVRPGVQCSRCTTLADATEYEAVDIAAYHLPRKNVWRSCHPLVIQRATRNVKTSKCAKTRAQICLCGALRPSDEHDGTSSRTPVLSHSSVLVSPCFILYAADTHRKLLPFTFTSLSSS